MAKLIRVEFPGDLDKKDRKSIKRLCRRLGKIKSSSTSLVVKVRRLPAGKVIRFLACQPKIISVQKI